MSMARAQDVAAYILKKQSPMTAMKLQKLLYYSQAWSLVWDEEPLFPERIEAWANGPVLPTIYQMHKTMFKLNDGDIDGKATALTKAQRETVDAVVKSYGKKPSQWLSDLTHREAPWKDARVGLGMGERGNRVIKHSAMAEYYDSLK